MTKYLYILVIIMVGGTAILAQEKTLIQVRTFDPTLQPLPAVILQINDSVKVKMSERGLNFLEIDARNLPPTTINTTDQQLEVESWNYSQGELEVILKPSSYRIATITVKDRKNRLLQGLKVKLIADNPIVAVSDNRGQLELPVPTGEDLNQINLFQVEGFRVLSQEFKGQNGVLRLAPLSTTENVKRGKVVMDQDSENFRKFDLDNLDSIRSLTVFYAVIRHIDVSKLDEDLKSKIDQKFQELLSQREDSLNAMLLDSFLQRITSNSPVQEDVDLLINQALTEELALDLIKTAFDKKVNLISQKLEHGGLNLPPKDRQEILLDLDRLSEILKENENKFFRNREQYENILNSLRNRLANIGELEQQLTASERQRAQERQRLNRKLFIAILSALVLALIMVLFIILSRKFRKQKNDLALANAEVNRINNNLEVLVAQRTALLRETNKELETFLYRSSHDLRRPLCTIVGLTNLAKHPNGSSITELCDKVTYTVKKMDHMLNKLISVSEINHPSKFETIDFHLLMEAYLADQGEFIQEQKIHFDYKFDPDIDYKSHPHLISIIINNLLDNAIWYSTLSANGQPPKVDLQVYHDDGKVKLTISDNGPGISPSVKEKIWDMFYVGHEKSAGNGLGLYLVKKAVKVLNGSVKFYIEDKNHTVFEVVLPRTHSSTIC